MAAMIATALFERRLGTVMNVPCLVIGDVERVPGKRPSGPVTKHGDDEYGCDEMPKH